jgi:hypothetical protein
MFFKTRLPNHLNLSTGLQNWRLLTPSTTAHNPRMTTMVSRENFNDHSILTMLSHRQQNPLITPFDHYLDPDFQPRTPLGMSFG